VWWGREEGPASDSRGRKVTTSQATLTGVSGQYITKHPQILIAPILLTKEIGSPNMGSILQIQKLRLREVSSLARGHKAGEEQKLDLNPSLCEQLLKE
jgi:hypothetical protein